MTIIFWIIFELLVHEGSKSLFTSEHVRKQRIILLFWSFPPFLYISSGTQYMGWQHHVQAHSPSSIQSFFFFLERQDQKHIPLDSKFCAVGNEFQHQCKNFGHSSLKQQQAEYQLLRLSSELYLLIVACSKSVSCLVKKPMCQVPKRHSGTVEMGKRNKKII